MRTTITVLVVDDHALVRNMLAARLGAEPDLRVVGCAADAEEAVTLAVKHRPDVILMDIDMPGLACFDAARLIQTRSADTRIVFLSAFFHDRYIEQAMAVRAWGYVTKSEPEGAVIQAVRKVAAGVAYFSPAVQARIVVDEGGAWLGQAGVPRAALLTDRETQVLRYLAQGLSKKEIGRLLHVSANTVNRHATGLMMKLDIHDRVELARFAIREGLAEA